MNPDLHPFETQLATAWPVDRWQDVTVMVALSGGADSVALLRAMRRLKTAGRGRLVAGHFNHGLRVEQSDADEAFVVQLCRQMEVHCDIGRGQVAMRAGVDRDGLEAAARSARYEFLHAAAQRAGARYVATAHTANDHAETILHRILRGTGVSGLAGIPRARPLGPAVTLIRPLLAAGRCDVLEYLDAVDQPYCEDHTNLDQRLTRNRIRHDLLPKLEADYNAGVAAALVRLGQLAGDAQAVIDELVTDLAVRAVARRGPDRLAIDASALGGTPRHVVRELLIAAWREQDWPLQDMGFAQWEELADMLLGTPQPPRRTMPGNVQVEKRDDELILSREA